MHVNIANAGFFRSASIRNSQTVESCGMFRQSYICTLNMIDCRNTHSPLVSIHVLCLTCDKSMVSKIGINSLTTKGNVTNIVAKAIPAERKTKSNFMERY